MLCHVGFPLDVITTRELLSIPVYFCVKTAPVKVPLIPASNTLDMAHEPSSGPAETGSRTTTQTGTPTQGDGRQEDRAGPSQPVVGVLKLRGDRPVRRQKVGWTEGTIDNEGLGKKKSKSMSLTPLADLWRVAYIGAVCCIYHKPKTFDESSDESSSDESDCDHRHHPKHERGHTTRRRGVDKASEQEQSDNGSSESEGGAGDGRAR